MANQTLAEATYTKTIIDKKETIDRNITSVILQVEGIMTKLTELHDLVEDAQSKTEVLATRQDMIDQLTAAVAI